ncbi:hypothetical protein PG990_005251 [Apiospora arundinis]
MADPQNHRDQQPGLEVAHSEYNEASSPQVVQPMSGESAPEVALPDHVWIYPVHDADEQQKVLPGGVLLQQRLQQTSLDQQYSPDYNSKYQSLRGKHFLTTPEVVPYSADGSTLASEYGGHQTPSETPLGEASIVQPPQKRSRRKIIIIAVVVTFIITGAVVGGVVGALMSRPNSGGHVWRPWLPTSVAPGFAPTAISRGYPHMEVFALSSNKERSVYRKYRNSNATSANEFMPYGLEMELVGGDVDRDKTPSISVSWRHHVENGVPSNRTELHIAGTFKNKVFRKYRDRDGADSWSPGPAGTWDVFETGTWASSPTQVRYPPDASLMAAFFLCKAQPGLGICFWQWTPENNWSLAGNPIAGKSDLQSWAAPAAVAWNGDDSRLDVFAVSHVNNHLMHTWRDGSSDSLGTWAPYEDLKGFVTTPPVAVARAPGVLDNGNWSSWELLSGPGFQIQGQPEAISTSADTIDVFVWGVKGELLHKKFNNSADPKWAPSATASLNGGFEVIIDKGLSGPPKAVTDGTGLIHLLAYDENNNIILTTLSSKPGVDTTKTVIATVP